MPPVPQPTAAKAPAGPRDSHQQHYEQEQQHQQQCKQKYRKARAAGRLTWRVVVHGCVRGISWCYCWLRRAMVLVFGPSLFTQCSHVCACECVVLCLLVLVLAGSVRMSATFNLAAGLSALLVAGDMQTAS
jgi:hypothetical protein